jgi:hypothetical protein
MGIATTRTEQAAAAPGLEPVPGARSKPLIAQVVGDLTIHDTNGLA